MTNPTEMIPLKSFWGLTNKKLVSLYILAVYLELTISVPLSFKPQGTAIRAAGVNPGPERSKMLLWRERDILGHTSASLVTHCLLASIFCSFWACWLLIHSDTPSWVVGAVLSGIARKI